jgi:succinate dehydrogenase/fumarate reductase flavoprotein subunit
LLLDVEDDPSAGGNSAIGGGGVHISRLSLDSDPARLKRRIMYAPFGNVREDIADLIATNAGRAYSWLLGHGVEFEKEAPGDIKAMLAPLRDLADAHAWRDRGPHRMMQRLQEAFVSGGGTIRSSTRARELVVTNGAVTGVLLANGDRSMPPPSSSPTADIRPTPSCGSGSSARPRTGSSCVHRATVRVTAYSWQKRSAHSCPM